MTAPRRCRACAVFQGGSDTASRTDRRAGGLFGPRRNTTPIDQLDRTHGLMAFAAACPWVLPEAFDQGKWHFSSVDQGADQRRADPDQHEGRPDFRPHIYRADHLGSQYRPAVQGSYRGDHQPPVDRASAIASSTRDQPVGVAIVARAQGWTSRRNWSCGTKCRGCWRGRSRACCGPRPAAISCGPDESRTAAENVRRDSNIVVGFVDDCVDVRPGQHGVGAGLRRRLCLLVGRGQGQSSAACPAARASSGR